MKKVNPKNLTVNYNKQGLVPAVVQDDRTKQVLMMAWMNEDALRQTQATGQATFWSRSRKELWRKGETSGNTLDVREMWIDCDNDTLLLLVDPAGPACHTGNVSCFYQAMEDEDVG